MATNAMSEVGSKPESIRARGLDVIEEAATFLRQMKISADRGAYASGRHVAVMIDPRWNADKKSIRVLVTCYAFGHRQVDWAGLPIFVLREDLGPLDIEQPRLNARGQAVIPELPPGAYHVLASPQWGAGSLPSVADRPWTRVYPSMNRMVLTTVSCDAKGEVAVAAETGDSHYEGAVLQFSVRLRGSRPLPGTLTLAPCEDRKGLWEGRWVYQVQLGYGFVGEEDNEVTFCVVPRST